ncbi:unnamed protein product [Orchesella dallaii]|uniref:Uncharacterized protein n=1 Tax=Orchesella dallaii TaxID=48710 RepID=A0ABP1RGF2_9HEXA
MEILQDFDVLSLYFFVWVCFYVYGSMQLIAIQYVMEPDWKFLFLRFILQGFSALGLGIEIRSVSKGINCDEEVTEEDSVGYSEFSTAV